MGTCSVRGCEQETHARGWCGKHYRRWMRHGDVFCVGVSPRGERHPDWTGDRATYLAVHHRLYRERGYAKSYTCITCERPAQQWAYQHGDPDELIDSKGRVYSTNLDLYEPMCALCHTAFDGRAAA